MKPPALLGDAVSSVSSSVSIAVSYEAPSIAGGRRFFFVFAKDY
jgi:hypothetical protein